jgi:N-acetylneuraminate synthase
MNIFGAGRPVGSVTVIAEVGQAHDGSLGMAHAFIDAAADCGADAIKFQTHIAEAESTVREPWRVHFSTQDETRFEYWKRMEFTEQQWKELAKHARERELFFLSSPFSFEAFELLKRVGVAAWKVASGEVSNLPLLAAMAQTRLPILLSSGMSGWLDLDRAVNILRGENVQFSVLQCTTEYPTPPERVGLNVLKEIGDRYGCPVGLSDHSGLIYPGLAAVALGANIIEVHVTMSRRAFGPDVPASLTFDEFGDLVRGIRFIGCALQNPVDKNQAIESLEDLRVMFGKSVVAAVDLSVGKILSGTDLALKKPGGGIPPVEMESLVGKRLSRSLARDEMIRKGDVE